ncbi:MAG: hypothetical protein HUK06_08885 [Bacteroidaceae bacterium]|nr:hypothetical protein [Bacteroidaceae bacterium]
MKYHGCVLDFTDQRNDALMKAYREAICECEQICIADIAQRIVNKPCERFWVSEERAMVVCAALMQGKPILEPMRPTKREMFQEIYKRVMDMKKGNEDCDLLTLVVHVVNSPAPKFYMRPRCAMEIIYKVKKGFYENQFRR